MNVSTKLLPIHEHTFTIGTHIKSQRGFGSRQNIGRERQKKDLLGTILYNYSESYTICGVCDDFIADCI